VCKARSRDLHRAADEIIILTGGGTPLDRNRIYSVAMNNYMTQVYNYGHSDPGQSLFFTTADALISYLKKHNTVSSYRGEKRFQINGDETRNDAVLCRKAP
jgi:5'-nucleotidase